MKVKMVKNAHKAWSTWTGAALAALIGANQALPEVQGILPDAVYGYAVLALAVATPVLRFIDQGLPKNDGDF